MGAAGVLRPFTDDPQPRGTPMPKDIDLVADVLASTDRRIGQGLKLPPLLAELPDDVRQSLNRAIRLAPERGGAGSAKSRGWPGCLPRPRCPLPSKPGFRTGVPS